MSYGVLGSKNGHLLVETTTGARDDGIDAAFHRFQTAWGATWVPGRLTITALHLTFMPNRVGRGAGMLKLDLHDLTGIELGGSGLSRVVGLRTAGHVGRLRCHGAPALAEQIAGLVAEARRTPAPTTRRRPR